MRNLIIAFLVSMSLLPIVPAQAAPTADVTQNKIVLKFPETATFQITVSSSVEIKSIVLEYGNEQQTCGEVLAKAFPQFTPATTVDAEWTWDMRQSGSLPPGTQLWWRWRITDANGNETVAEMKTATWLDSVHSWQTVTSGQLSLHYYGISKASAQARLNAGLEGLNLNKNDAGLTTDSPINIYIYRNQDDLKEAILYEPSWVGGEAFAEENIVILSTSGDENWDKTSVVHELTHVLVGHFTFSCLGDVPQWLDEGLAVYSEGPQGTQFGSALQEAIQADTLLSVRSISGSFSEVSDKADLSYAESYSIVNYLIQTYGQQKMTALLSAFRDGATTDEALQQTYGFNIDGLEDRWRAAIGAQPRTDSVQPTAIPSATFVPTIVPISGGVVPAQATITPVPTSTFNEQSTPEVSPTRAGPPLALSLILLAFCCVLLLILGVIVLAIIVGRQNRKGGNDVR